MDCFGLKYRVALKLPVLHAAMDVKGNVSIALKMKLKLPLLSTILVIVYRHAEVSFETHIVMSKADKIPSFRCSCADVRMSVCRREK